LREFGPVYKRRSDKNIHVWSIQVEGDKYRTVSGVLDGEMVVSEWTTCRAKNEGKSNSTTSETQAIAEAQAKYEKKVNQGRYHEKLNDVDKSKFFAPMLAHEWNKEKAKVQFPVFSQPKLDGMRCIATEEGLFTRNGKKILSVPHIHESLQPLFSNDPDLVLDGELYCDKYANDFNKIISLCRKSKPKQKDLIESAESVQYWIYDLPSSTQTFQKRSESLGYLLSGVSSSMVVLVPTTLAHDSNQLDELYTRYLEKGLEGQMVRLPDSLYENKRSKFLLKRKEFVEKEFTIVSVNEGTGNRSGMAGNLTMQNDNGKTFKTNIRGGFEFYKKLLKEKDDLVGKQGTVVFFDYTPAGIPRFPYLKSIRDYD